MGPTKNHVPLFKMFKVSTNNLFIIIIIIIIIISEQHYFSCRETLKNIKKARKRQCVCMYVKNSIFPVVMLYSY